MNAVRNILARVFAAWAILLFVGTMLVILIPVWFLGLLSEPLRTDIFIRISRAWMGVFLPLSGCPLSIYGKQHFRKGENYIVVCNHNAMMDVPISSPGIPGANKTIAKKEMADIPLFGIIYKRGSVLVDRKSDESRAKSYEAMKQVLAMGMHMCIYPEGTRNRTDKPLKEFKDGAFRLAIETGKPIIPAVIFNTRKVMPASRFIYFWPTPLSFHFLPPIPTQHLNINDVQILKQQVFSTMYTFIESSDSFTEQNCKKSGSC